MFAGNTPSEIKFSFETDLYLTLKHLQTQVRGRAYAFLLFVQSETQADAILNLNEVNQTGWISPAKAPFGGIQCAENLSNDDILFLLKCAESFVRGQGGKHITIKSAPAVYHFPPFQQIFSVYENAGYLPVSQQTNLHIMVSSKAFETIIIPAERRRLNKCKKAGFALDRKHTIKEIYAFIASVRKRQKYPVSISCAELTILFENFPENFGFFSVYHGEQLIAATVTVRVNAHTLYNFLCADLSAYRSFSPTVMLLEGVYNYCQEQDIKILDLGTSDDESGQEKPGLIRFKKNIGGLESRKITWQKHLDSQTITRFVENG